MKNNFIWVLNKKEISSDALKLLEDNNFKLLYEPKNSQLSQIVGIFVRTHVQVDQILLDSLPNIQFILKAGVGLDNINVSECEIRGIKVFNSPGANASSVAEYVVANMLNSLRKFKEQELLLRSGGWRSYDLMGNELAGKNIGLIGFGAVGKTVAKMLSNFNVKLYAYDPYVRVELANTLKVELVDLKQLIKSSDVISVQIPLTPETKDLIADREISMMKDGVILINVSRGEIVNEKAITGEIGAMKFGGLVLDVFCNEPNIDPRLNSVINSIITPHVAGFTHESHRRMAINAVENMLTYFRVRKK